MSDRFACDDYNLGYLYLATPYSKFPGGRDAAFKAALDQTSLLTRAGHIVFSPIVHAHLLTVHGAVEGSDFHLWERHDKAMMKGASGLIVCKLPGWQESVGVRAEIAWWLANESIVRMWTMEPDNAQLVSAACETAPLLRSRG